VVPASPVAEDTTHAPRQARGSFDDPRARGGLRNRPGELPGDAKAASDPWVVSSFPKGSVAAERTPGGFPFFDSSSCDRAPRSGATRSISECRSSALADPQSRADRRLDTRDQPRRFGGEDDENEEGGPFDPDRARELLLRRKTCGTVWQVQHHTTCGARVAVPASCDLRTCVRCAKERKRREVHRYEPAVLSFTNPAHLVLTVPNARTPVELAEGVALIWGAFSKARRWTCWAKGSNGKRARGVAALEITWSEAAGYHPHLHVLFDGRFRDLKKFQRKWMKAVGGKHWPHIERRPKDERSAMLHEVLKYVLKPEKSAHPESVEAAILGVIDHKRTFRSFGGLRAVLEDDQEEREPLCCPRCGEERSGCSHTWILSLVPIEDLAALEAKHPGFFFRGWRQPRE